MKMTDSPNPDKLDAELHEEEEDEEWDPDEEEEEEEAEERTAPPPPGFSTPTAARYRSICTTSTAVKFAAQFIPPEYGVCFPRVDQRAHAPPPGYTSIYTQHFLYGLRLPLPPFVVSLLAKYRIALAQLHPASIVSILGFIELCKTVSVTPTLTLFRRFFRLRAVGQRTEGWYTFCAILPKIVYGPKAGVKWKTSFMFFMTQPGDVSLSWNHSAIVDPPLTADEMPSKETVRMLLDNVERPKHAVLHPMASANNPFLSLLKDTAALEELLANHPMDRATLEDLLQHPGKGTTIAILDTGLADDHFEFKDEGSEIGNNDRKIDVLVYKDGWSPKDIAGHGSHVASLAAGRICGNAPFANLRIYKVINQRKTRKDENSFCRAMRDAIEYGVDIISISLSGNFQEFDEDIIAKWACRATMRGILVVCCAGNSRTDVKLCNQAPYILVVGSGHTNKCFAASIKLKDGKGTTLSGDSFYHFSSAYSFILFFSKSIEEIKKEGDLGNIKGKVVVVEIGIAFEVVAMVKNYSGLGLIIINQKKDRSFCSYLDFPTINVCYADGKVIQDYISQSYLGGNTPKAIIQHEELKFWVMPKKSSRGPGASLPYKHFLTRKLPFIIKPDVAAPGRQIIGAHMENGKMYIRKSGTSMATAIVSGSAAVIKSIHGKWYSEVLKSVLMESANIMDDYGNPIMDVVTSEAASVFALGSGRVDIVRAIDPGLVYHSDPKEYMPRYLRGLKYSEKRIRDMVGEGIDIGGEGDVLETHNLNYPSFAIAFKRKTPNQKIKCTRRVTNVGKEEDSCYKLVVPVNPPGVKMEVKPQKLVFSSQEKTQEFIVEFELEDPACFPENGISEGCITWISENGRHSVRSPVAVAQNYSDSTGFNFWRIIDPCLSCLYPCLEHLVTLPFVILGVSITLMLWSANS